MDIKQNLEYLDITGKKADVYMACLELGSGTVIEISKKAGIKRTNCYDILFSLIEEGLVSETAKGNKRLFVGEDPEKIIKKFEQKRQALNELMPQLKSIYNTKGIKPKIKFFEGKEGIKSVYADTLSYQGEILAFATEDVVKIMDQQWVQEYLRKRISKKIHLRAILPKTDILVEGFTSKDQEQYRMSKLIDPKKYPFSVEINIYGFQKVALMSAREETGVIIEGAEIYKTMKLIFELLWDNLPEIKIK